jgi:hypothetical protein
VVGDIRNSKWIDLGQPDLLKTEDGIRIAVDECQAPGIVLLSEKARLPSLVQKVERFFSRLEPLVS